VFIKKVAIPQNVTDILSCPSCRRAMRLRSV